MHSNRSFRKVGVRLPFDPVKRLLDFHFFQQEVTDYSPEPVILKFQIIDLTRVLDAVGNRGLRFVRYTRQGVGQRGKFPPSMKRHDADTEGFAGVLLRLAVLHHVVREAKLGANFLKIVSLHLILATDSAIPSGFPTIQRSGIPESK
jgi:hypothetical protein